MEKGGNAFSPFHREVLKAFFEVVKPMELMFFFFFSFQNQESQSRHGFLPIQNGLRKCHTGVAVIPVIFI